MSKPPSLTLYQYSGATPHTTFSPPCAKVQMALHFKGLAFEVRNMGSPRHIRRLNPRGRVPVLRIGEELVADSSDILDLLEARFPEPPLVPSDPKARAEARLWEDWADEVLYFYGANLRWRDDESFARLLPAMFGGMPRLLQASIGAYVRRMVVRRLKGQGVGLKDMTTCRRETWECFDLLAMRLDDRRWLAGEALSRADLAAAGVIDQFASTSLMPESAAQVAARPALVAWLERVHQAAPSVADP
ncbi:MAG TPA: glutathione S-transferase family protein [Planctomycetota bacterium]